MMGIDSGRLFRIIAPFLPSASVTPSASVDSVCGRSDDVLVHRTKGGIKRKPTEGGFQPKMQSGREKENAASSTRLNRAKQEIAVLCLTRSTTSAIRRASCIIAGAKLDLVRERATDADASLHEQNPAPPL